MKNTFTSIALALAIICVSQIWAQDSVQPDAAVQAGVQVSSSALVEADVASQPDKTETDTTETNATEPPIGGDQADAEASRISIDIDLDGADEDKDGLKKLAKIIREVAGDDVANEVIIELDGLSEEEKQEIREGFAHGIPMDFNAGWVGVVALVAVLLFVGAPIWILLVVFIFGARKRKQKMELIQMYLDSDKNVPPQVLATFGQSGSSFRSGIMFSAVGLGILAAFGAADNESAGAIGLIPLFIGIAKLLYWFVEERKFESN